MEEIKEDLVHQRYEMERALEKLNIFQSTRRESSGSVPGLEE